MGPHVIGMPVSAVGVVGHHDVRPQCANDVDERADGFAFVGVTEPLRTLPAARFGARHARVPPAPRPAEEDRRVDTQGAQRRGQFSDAVAAELVRVIDGKLRPTVADDLAFFAESAGDDVHLSPACRVVGDGGAIGDAFVIRVGVYEQQPRRLLHGRTIPVWSVATESVSEYVTRWAAAT